MTDPNLVWDCEAYGREGKELGALCFFGEPGEPGEPGERVCGDPGQCTSAMAAERERVFNRIHAMAEGGDSTAKFLAAEFTSPDQLLNGPYPAGEEKR